MYAIVFLMPMFLHVETDKYLALLTSYNFTFIKIYASPSPEKVIDLILTKDILFSGFFDQ